jgi:phosphohistidine phosphatase SixA
VRFLVIRHSVRETPDDFSDAEEGDPEAELTDDGRDIAEALGKWMGESGEIPTVLMVSPTVRAQQTAEIIRDQIEEAGFAPPQIKTDVSIGPHMSIRGCVLECLADESAERVGIISHRDSIKNGLQQLGNGDKPDPMAMGELRSMKIKRKSGKWEEKQRILPSDLGLSDSY